MKTLVLLLLVAVAQSKVYERCEWARVMKANGLDGFHGYSLANWVCLTKWESKYNTQAIHHNTDKSTDYGIFQINSRYWCDDSNQNYKTTISKNGCGIKCSQLLTADVGVAISCAKRVVKDPNGMAAWYGWRNNCKGRDLRTYLAGCGL